MLATMPQPSPFSATAPWSRCSSNAPKFAPSKQGKDTGRTHTQTCTLSLGMTTRLTYSNWAVQIWAGLELADSVLLSILQSSSAELAKSSFWAKVGKELPKRITEQNPAGQPDVGDPCSLLSCKTQSTQNNSGGGSVSVSYCLINCRNAQRSVGNVGCADYFHCSGQTT